MPVFQSIWPSGSYGLPKPSSGCPDNNWKEGFRYQDSENVENTNLKSNGSHLSGTVNQHGVRQEFCLHLDTHEERIPWPRGKYCIYRKGRNCPVGLHEGMIAVVTFHDLVRLCVYLFAPSLSFIAVDYLKGKMSITQ